MQKLKEVNSLKEEKAKLKNDLLLLKKENENLSVEVRKFKNEIRVIESLLLKEKKSARAEERSPVIFEEKKSISKRGKENRALGPKTLHQPVKNKLTDKKLNNKLISLDLPGIKLEKLVRNHTDVVTSVCQTKDGRIVTSSDDETIKVFNLKDFTCDLVLEGHTNCVNYVSVLNNGWLVSSSCDKTIKIWKIFKTYHQCSQTLIGHNHWVFKAIQATNNRIISCSFDKTIRVWSSFFPNECKIVLKGHTGAVYSVIELKAKNYFVSGGNDRTLRFWSQENYECVKIIYDVYCCYRNSLVELEDSRLIVGGRNEISVVSTSSLQFERKMKFSEDVGWVYSILEFSPGNMLCGCDAGLLSIDVDNLKLIKTRKEIHEESVTGLLKIKDGLLLSSSADKTLKFWRY